MSTRRKVFLPQNIPDEGKEYLEKEGCEIVMASGVNEETLIEEGKDCDAILLRTATISAPVLRAAKKLKVVGRNGAGVDNVDVDEATRLGIFVTNAPFSNTISVAEHAIGLIVALAHNINKFDNALRKVRDFSIRDPLMGTEINKKTLGVIGFGKIGSLVAKKANYGLGLKVIAYDPMMVKENIPPYVEVTDHLNYLLEKSDYISIHVPLTNETRYLIGADQLSLMKSTAFLINLARGGVVCEEALITALQKGSIQGAGIDVFEVEPPNKDNPLYEMDNVIMTPHIAGVTKESIVRMTLHAALGIIEVLSGKKATWPVNEPLNPRIKLFN